MPNKIYLIPNTVSEEDLSVIPQYIAGIAARLRFFLVEEEKSARRLLKKLCPEIPLQEFVLRPLNEHTSASEVKKYLDEAGDQDIGIISEAGCPCIADPGANVVLLAHQNNSEVVPLVGPSSIILALMASGLTGQNFAFNGYLPKEKEERRRKIKELEKRSQLEKQTQIFMEAPYRNNQLLEDILVVCHSQTLLCVACDLTAPAQFIKTLPVKEWKLQKIDLNKRPALFLICTDLKI